MKKNLSILFLLAFTLFALAEEKEVNVSLGTSYANQVFVKLGTDSVTTVAASAWDVMFNKTSSFSFSMRVNDARIQVYEAFNNYNSSITQQQWDTIGISNLSKPLYNSETAWNKGAFDNVAVPEGTSGYPYGWGYYDMNTHHLFGSAIFLLKYSDGTFRKFKVDDYWSGYTVSYATWDAATSSWGATATSTISNSTGFGYSYNFFSFTTNSVVESIPADSQWDFVFTQYQTNLGTTMYKVTGVLQGYATKVAKSTDGTAPAESNYSSQINTIGYDWKTFSSSSFTYTLTNDKYFVKSSDGVIYKLWFTSFVGSSNGNLAFRYSTDLSSISTESAASSLSFQYSSASKELFLENASANSSVTIFSLAGQKAFGATVSDNSLSLDNLKSGIYIVTVKSGSESKQGKIIVP